REEGREEGREEERAAARAEMVRSYARTVAGLLSMGHTLEEAMGLVPEEISEDVRRSMARRPGTDQCRPPRWRGAPLPEGQGPASRSEEASGGRWIVK
ncbi:MAG: hypothetical protein J5674_02775, partial [Candidatus Methanomethylophilaceae archaeon]|nr:hypothetical protein [Candidatus Methanomethylophilaceae archaeon]